MIISAVDINRLIDNVHRPSMFVSECGRMSTYAPRTKKAMKGRETEPIIESIVQIVFCFGLSMLFDFSLY
jgi:hypothetical protein